MSLLEGRTAIVTGAAAGLGNAIATELAREGANIAVLDIDRDGAPAAAETLSSTGVRARPYEVDVSVSADVNAVFAKVHEDFGRLDIVVNNAGVSFVGPHIEDTTDEAWDRAIGVMQTGVFYCMRAASTYFLPQRSGSIVNISSIRGFSPNPGRIAYCAAKSAVIMMTHVAAGEWAPYNIRVNAIAPGVQKTPMWDADVVLGVVDEEKVLATTPAGRLGQPREVGRLAVYLCSDDAAFVNGSCVTIDGGLTSVPIDGTIIRPA
jgi:NAD(P)-dependent dehydrogenase (short-subunit alcohol dehydrogenase family)